MDRESVSNQTGKTETVLFYLHSFTLQTTIYQHEFNSMQIKLKPSISARPCQSVDSHRDCPQDTSEGFPSESCQLESSA